MQKRPVPSTWAGEFPQDVIREFGVLVKVLVTVFQTRRVTSYLILKISIFKRLGRYSNYSTSAKGLQALNFLEVYDFASLTNGDINQAFLSNFDVNRVLQFPRDSSLKFHPYCPSQSNDA